jgi:hypothetical protein
MHCVELELRVYPPLLAGVALGEDILGVLEVDKAKK